jgi:hypothetical protein
MTHDFGQLLGEVHNIGLVDVEACQTSHFGYISCGNGGTRRAHGFSAYEPLIRKGENET